MKIVRKNTKCPVPLKLQNWAKRVQRGKRFGAIRYPARFKEECLTLMRNGMEPGVLRKSLGISLISLESWKKAQARELDLSKGYPAGVRELTLIADTSERREIQDRIRIQLGSKVWIEASASVLQGSLLRELASLEAT